MKKYFETAQKEPKSYLLLKDQTRNKDHGRIENSLYWCLDLCLDEDHCRMRVDNSAENFAVLRHIAINLYKSFSSVKLSLKAKRF